MSNISQKARPSKELLQEWMDGIAHALTHIPAGHQVDLARQIVEEHYPYAPDLTFQADRGDIMLWAAAQEVRLLSIVLDEIIVEMGARNIPEVECKRMMKVAWDQLSDGSKEAFLEWAQREVSTDGQ